jgi:hypothetical protein
LIDFFFLGQGRAAQLDGAEFYDNDRCVTLGIVQVILDLVTSTL